MATFLNTSSYVNIITDNATVQKTLTLPALESVNDGTEIRYYVTASTNTTLPIIAASGSDTLTFSGSWITTTLPMKTLFTAVADFTNTRWIISANLPDIAPWAPDTLYAQGQVVTMYGAQFQLTGAVSLRSGVGAVMIGSERLNWTTISEPQFADKVSLNAATLVLTKPWQAISCFYQGPMNITLPPASVLAEGDRLKFIDETSNFGVVNVLTLTAAATTTINGLPSIQLTTTRDSVEIQWSSGQWQALSGTHGISGNIDVRPTKKMKFHSNQHVEVEAPAAGVTGYTLILPTGGAPSVGAALVGTAVSNPAGTLGWKDFTPTTALGDLLIGSATASTVTALPIGTTGQVLKVAGGTATWAAEAADSDIFKDACSTAAGGVVYSAGGNAAATLAAGTSGQYLKSLGSTVTWDTPTDSDIFKTACSTAAGGVVYSAGGNAAATLAAGTSGQYLKSLGSTVTWDTPASSDTNFAANDLTTTAARTHTLDHDMTLNTAATKTFKLNGSTTSTSTTTGTLVVAGGAGISENVNVGGKIKTTDTTASSTATTGALQSAGGLGVSGSAFIGATGQALVSLGDLQASDYSSGSLRCPAGGISCGGNLWALGTAHFGSTTDATSLTDSGTAVLGGLAVEKKILLCGGTGTGIYKITCANVSDTYYGIVLNSSGTVPSGGVNIGYNTSGGAYGFIGGQGASGGSDSVSIGYGSGNASNSNTVCVGLYAGQNNAGDHSVCVGPSAGANMGATSVFVGNGAIGATSAANQLVIANNATTGQNLVQGWFNSSLLSRSFEVNGLCGAENYKHNGITAVKTADYTATTRDSVVQIDSGVITVTLPAASLKLQMTIKGPAGGNQGIIAAASGETINGASTFTIATTATVIGDGGTNWIIIAKY